MLLTVFAIAIIALARAQNITYGNETFVLLRRDNKHADYGLLTEYEFTNSTNTTLQADNFEGYFLTGDIVDGNLLVGLAGVFVETERSMTSNFTVRPLRLVERGEGGKQGATINLFNHTDGWYNINTGTIGLPESFSQRLNSLGMINSNNNNDTVVTIASVRYISNTTGSQNQNTTVQVTLLYLPSLRNQTVVGMGMQLQVANFPFQFNGSSILLESDLITAMNLTNGTRLDNNANTAHVVDVVGAANSTSSLLWGPALLTDITYVDGKGKEIDEGQALARNASAIVSSPVPGQPNPFVVGQLLLVNRTALEAIFDAPPPQTSQSIRQVPLHSLILLFLFVLLV